MRRLPQVALQIQPGARIWPPAITSSIPDEIASRRIGDPASVKELCEGRHRDPRSAHMLIVLNFPMSPLSALRARARWGSIRTKSTLSTHCKKLNDFNEP